MGANEDDFYPEPFASQPCFSNRQSALSDKTSLCFARASGDKDRPFKQQTYGIEPQEEQKKKDGLLQNT